MTKCKNCGRKIKQVWVHSVRGYNWVCCPDDESYTKNAEPEQKKKRLKKK